MARCGVDFKGYDGFFLSMIVVSLLIIVSVDWRRYRFCAHPLHIWIVTDYTAVVLVRILMFLDDVLAAGMGLYVTSLSLSPNISPLLLPPFILLKSNPNSSESIGWLMLNRLHSPIAAADPALVGWKLSDLGWQQRYTRFCGRIAVLSVLVLLLYPFLCVWTVIGTLWFSSAKGCFPESRQKWAFLIWLLFSYWWLAFISCVGVGKWLIRRRALQPRAQQGIPISEF